MTFTHIYVHQIFQVQKEKDIPNSDKKIVTKINTNISVRVQDKNEQTSKKAAGEGEEPSENK